MIRFLNRSNKCNYNMFLFNSKDEMLDSKVMKENDYATVYNKVDASQKISIETKEYNAVTFPGVVTLTRGTFPRIPQEVIDEATSRNSNSDNIVILQNSKTKEFYFIVCGSRADLSKNYSVAISKDTFGYICPGWNVLTLIKYESGAFVEVPRASFDTNSFVQFDWGDYKLVPVYSKKDILYLQEIDGNPAGSTFFQANNVPAVFGSYPDSLPFISVDKDKAEFFFEGFTEKVVYNTKDGINYYRVDSLPLTVTCSVTFTKDIIDSFVSQFIFVDTLPNLLEGIYQYKNGVWETAPSLLNAIPAEILMNRYAFTVAGTVRGTMSNKGEVTIIPTESEQVKESGYYDKITIIGDANLLPENIKQGVTIFGVTGTYTETST